MKPSPQSAPSSAAADAPGKLGLVRYDAMCQAIAACEKVDEVKEIRDRARAFECYAQQALNIEAERKAAEIRLRAERHAGRLLKRMKQAGERVKRGHRPRKELESVGPIPIATLAELGITGDQSSQWQRLADIPDEEFEAELTRPGPKPTTEGLLHALRPTPAPEPPRIDPQALAAWGWMRTFEDSQLPDTSPAALYAGMTISMQEDVIRLAPQLIAWLKAFEVKP